MRSLVLACLTLSALAGCADSDPAPTSGEAGPWFIPGANNETIPEPFTRFGDLVNRDAPGGGQGIWLHQGILLRTNGVDLHLYDARDPRGMVELGNITDMAGARDVDVLEWQGRTLALIAGSGKGMHVVDVTDPTRPDLLTTAEVLNAGVHNLAALPGTPYVYVSGASSERKIDVVDLSDPYNPTVSFFTIPDQMNVNGLPVPIPLNSNGCHDITVRVDLDRAYCAGGGSQYMSGGGETFIWDITDPLAPVWVGAVDDPRIIYHHQAFVNDDGTLLIINDEYIGAYQAGLGANNCYHFDVEQLPGALDPQIPFAAAWIYDISDEANPVLLSLVQNPSGWNGDGVPPNPLEGNCGAHFGDIIPGHDAFVMGWYEGGTILVGFEDPANPEVLDVAPPVAGQTWDAVYHNGWVFHSSGDLVATQLV